MMDYRLKTDIKSYFTKGKVYGKKGDRVKEVSKSGHVLIVETKAGEKFPVKISEVIPV
jgi:hypothetical protein